MRTLKIEIISKIHSNVEYYMRYYGKVQEKNLTKLKIEAVCARMKVKISRILQVFLQKREC